MLTALAVLAVVGVLLYLFNTLVTMDGRIKSAINALALLAVFLYLLGLFSGRHVLPGL